MKKKIIGLFCSLMLIIFIFNLGRICRAEQKVILLPSHSQEQGPSSDVKNQEEKIGPLEIGDRHFTIVLKKKEVIRENDLHDILRINAIRSIEIIDEKGLLHFNKQFEIGVKKDEFPECASVRSYVLESKGKKGLVIFYSAELEWPNVGVAAQVFALKGGILTPLSPPIEDYVCEVFDESNERSRKFYDRNIIIKICKSTGIYEVYVPLIVDLKSMTIKPLQYVGIFEVNAQRIPDSANDNEVNLLLSYSDNATSQKIVVRENSSVEFLGAHGKIKWNEDKERVSVSLEDKFLHVKIDGKDGWIKDRKDMEALGLYFPY